MEKFYTLINNPLLILLGAVIVFVIDKRDKIKALFPNTKKNLERLDLSKNFIKDSDDKELIDFYNSENENYNFYNLTGMTNSVRNQNLLLHYIKIKHNITWVKFKKIRQYIKTPMSYTMIETKPYRFKNYFFITVNSLLTLSIFLLIIYSLIKYKNEIEEGYPIIIILYILVVYPLVNLFNKFYEFKIIKEYNKIISERNNNA